MEKYSKPRLSEVMDKKVIFPDKEKDLPLIMMSRPHHYVILGRLISLLSKYIYLLFRYYFKKLNNN